MEQLGVGPKLVRIFIPQLEAHHPRRGVVELDGYQIGHAQRQLRLVAAGHADLIGLGGHGIVGNHQPQQRDEIQHSHPR